MGDTTDAPKSLSAGGPRLCGQTDDPPTSLVIRPDSGPNYQLTLWDAELLDCIRNNGFLGRNVPLLSQRTNCDLYVNKL